MLLLLLLLLTTLLHFSSFHFASLPSTSLHFRTSWDYLIYFLPSAASGSGHFSFFFFLFLLVRSSDFFFWFLGVRRSFDLVCVCLENCVELPQGTNVFTFIIIVIVIVIIVF